MSNTPKIDFVITARPSWSRVKKLIQDYIKIEGEGAARVSLVGAALSEKYGDIRSQIPSNYQLNVFETFSGNKNLFSVAKTSIDGANALSQFWSTSRPSSVFVVADRTETLGVSLTAATMQIPIIHLQGGEVSGSIDNKIRSANTKLADLHLTTNQFTAKNLINLGENEKDIIIIGCPSVDLVHDQVEKKLKPHPHSLHYGGVGANFQTELPYGIIMFHPDTFALSDNIDWIDYLLTMTQRSNLNWFWFWPNVDFGGGLISKRIRFMRESNVLSNLRYLKNLPPDTFINLAIHAKVLVGNSSFGIREASAIGLPVINLGMRQVGRHRAENVVDLQKPCDITKAVDEHSRRRFKKSLIYGEGNASRLGAEALRDWIPRIKNR